MLLLLHLCDLLGNRNLIFSWHLVVDFGHLPCFVVVLPGHFPEDVQESGQLDFVVFVGGLDTKNAHVVRVQILECLNDEVLSVECKALAQFQDFPLVGVLHLAEFNVLSGSNLPLLQNLLAVDIVPHLV
jgi:hypothetical protein